MCIYHITPLYMRQGDEFRVVGESLPYARYFSFQTTFLAHEHSDGTLRDVDVVPENGPNVYRDLDAAVKGQKQGKASLPQDAWRRRQSVSPPVSAVGMARR
jgi:hypothetical protein